MVILCWLSFVWALIFWFFSFFAMMDYSWPQSWEDAKKCLKGQHGRNGCVAWAWVIGAICTIAGIIGFLVAWALMF